MGRKIYDVSYRVTYRITVTANSEKEAEIKASEAEFWDWNDEDATGYVVEEVFDEE